MLLIKAHLLRTLDFQFYSFFTISLNLIVALDATFHYLLHLKKTKLKLRLLYCSCVKQLRRCGFQYFYLNFY